MTLQVVKLFLPDGGEYWCERKDMERVLNGMAVAHPEWTGKRFSAEQVEMPEEEYYRRPATNDPITLASLPRATDEGEAG